MPRSYNTQVRNIHVYVELAYVEFCSTRKDYNLADLELVIVWVLFLDSVFSFCLGRDHLRLWGTNQNDMKNLLWVLL